MAVLCRRTRPLPWAAVARALRAVAGYLNAIAGAPDYARYVAHIRQHHPGAEPLPEREFFRRAIDERYGGGKLRRCC